MSLDTQRHHGIVTARCEECGAVIDCYLNDGETGPWGNNHLPMVWWEIHGHGHEETSDGDIVECYGSYREVSHFVVSPYAPVLASPETAHIDLGGEA